MTSSGVFFRLKSIFFLCPRGTLNCSTPEVLLVMGKMIVRCKINAVLFNSLFFTVLNCNIQFCFMLEPFTYTDGGGE